jgi:sirohydrochlorin cobaltochelatase
MGAPRAPLRFADRAVAWRPVSDDFADAALVLVAHGSILNADSSGPARQHAAALRRRGSFARVLTAFWKQPPFVRDVLARVSEPRVFVVPLFIGEGYFTREVLPRELGFPVEDRPRFPRVRRRPDRTLWYCAPVGTHPRLTEVVLARAREVLEKHPAPRPVDPADITLFLVGHGTGRNEQSRQTVERQVRWIRSQHRYAGVHALFLEEAPGIGDCYRLATTRHLVVVPCFISDGLHTVEDIPVLLGESAAVVAARRRRGEWPWQNPTEKHGRLVWYTPGLGHEPRLADVILERVREATVAARPPVRGRGLGRLRTSSTSAGRGVLKVVRRDQG